jgi:hypothetical protein
MNESDLRLNGSERLLWSGAPRQGFMLRRSDAFAIPFSIFWGGFAIFWEGSVIKSNGPLFMKLWGIPFVLVGLYITIGRFFYDAWGRSVTTYAVTSERILIASRGKETSLALRTLSELTLESRSDGSGTIAFGSPASYASGSRRFDMSGTPQVPSFEGIPDAVTVHTLIQRAQREAR